MAQEFYIDSQFDIPYWIDVERGIVKKIYNGDEKITKKMNEIYVGETISFLKKDFEERMKPAFYCVHSSELASAMNKVVSAQSRRGSYNRHIRNQYGSVLSNLPSETQELIKKRRLEFDKEINKLKKGISKTLAKLKEDHSFTNIKLPKEYEDLVI